MRPYGHNRFSQCENAENNITAIFTVIKKPISHNCVLYDIQMKNNMTSPFLTSIRIESEIAMANTKSVIHIFINETI
jgi:hypothetical protein